MLSNNPHRDAGRLEHLRHQQSQAPITQNRHPFPPIQLDLLEHLKRRGQRLDENCLIVIDRVRQRVQIVTWQTDIIRKRAVVFENPQHTAIAAMRREPGQAQIASPANNIDLPHHALFD